MDNPAFFTHSPKMPETDLSTATPVDPLSEVISLLQPRAPFSKLVMARGAFRVRRDDVRGVFYCMVLAGRIQIEVDQRAPAQLAAGDFILVPDVLPFTLSSRDPAPAAGQQTRIERAADGVLNIGGRQDGAGAAPVQLLIGHCSFGSPDRELLLSLLPESALVRGEDRLAALATLVRDEVHAARPARDRVLEHLLQVLMIEAFRSAPTQATPGLLRGLSDPRLAPALRALHGAPGAAWSVPLLAAEAGLSRSAFFTRFNRIVGQPPMGYLLGWRMTLARHMLGGGQMGISEVARRTGYGSASAFTTAFTRHNGTTPARYAREMA
ncbi:AraC family transcriptional regulator [Pseudooceanicola sp. HF7]|nr:AraC family transcriptional regulator [Pseudooceanicola sp. HF7]